MNSRIVVHGLGLEIPHFVQTERFKKSFHATMITAAFTPSRRELRTLLHDINFEAKEGDRIAILGRNGAGKTTLLRVLTGAFRPTQGTLDMRGSCQALLNLGLGFNPEATIRENIYLRAIAMGMRSAQVHGLVESILEFAELEGVLNHRLLTLSSGQRMRLGFSISTSVQNDIMLLDEWLGAGDAAFVEKARQRMNDRVEGSKIVVLASHNFQMLRKVCNLGLVVDHGRQVYFGDLASAIAEYKKIYQSDPKYIARKKTKEGPMASQRKKIRVDERRGAQ